MDNYDNAIAYIDTQEATKISYVKVGDNSKNLIVSFASNNHTGFERKTSLMNIKYNRNNFDVLYLRNQSRWYLGDLNGIGENITYTISFLKQIFAKYDKVLCMGNSAGGYASLLFGSILNVNKVIAINAQTDLEYLVNNLSEDSYKKNLIERSKQSPIHWNEYNKIADLLSDKVSYSVSYDGDDKLTSRNLRILHGNYHYELIKHFPTVSSFETKKGLIPTIIKFIDE